MDYKKTNAPSNTITRNMVELCEDTGNVYETVAIIGKSTNQIAVENKRSSLHTTITWKKSLKTESKSKSLVITKSSRSRL